MTTWLANHRGLRALSARETARVLKLWTQTILAPILSSALFIVVFAALAAASIAWSGWLFATGRRLKP